MDVMTLPSTISGYASETAIFVNKQRQSSYELLQESNALGLAAKGTFQKLEEICNECSTPGWDGEHAAPISREVVLNAQMFLQSLPLGIEAPEIGAEPDGAITLEWYRSAKRVLSISINRGGWIYYAALIGASRRHGVDFALMGISEELTKLISTITTGAQNGSGR